jgi:hypothetical protein
MSVKVSWIAFVLVLVACGSTAGLDHGQQTELSDAAAADADSGADAAAAGYETFGPYRCCAEGTGLACCDGTPSGDGSGKSAASRSGKSATSRKGDNA